MKEIIRLPFIGEERTRILFEDGYDFDEIKDADVDDLSEVLGVSKYIAYLIIKAAKEVDEKNVPDELIARETICPKCGNIITELEYECGRCGYVIKQNMDVEEYEKKIKEYVDVFIEISHDPNNIGAWEKLMHVYEDLGNLEESLDVSLKIDLLKERGFLGEETGEGEEEHEEEKPELPLTAGPVISEKKEELSEIPTLPERQPKKKFKNGLVNGFGVKPMKFNQEVKKRKFIAIALVVGIVVGTLIGIFFMNPPYIVDGNISEWSGVPGYHTFDSDINVLKVGGYGDYYYMYIGGHLNLKEGISIVIDSDGNSGSGYLYKGLGLEYRIWINDKMKATLYGFSGTDQHNWSSWKEIGGLKVAGGSGGVELEIAKKYIGNDGVIKVINGIHETSPIGLFKSLVIGYLKLGGGRINGEEELGKLYLNNTYKSGVLVKGIKIENAGNATGVRIELYSDGKVLGEGKVGDYITFSQGLVVENSKEIDVYYAGGAHSGTTLRPEIKGILGTRGMGVSEGDGFYVNSTPGSPRIDGIYADWQPYRENASMNNLPGSEDIVAYAKYGDIGESYFYLQTRGELASGILIPVQSAGPKDSDRDGVPDSEDPYPYDFNNDGVPDKDSYVVVNGNREPDVDGDGIPDYPHGNDMWLNTTIPNSTAFPPEYRGKKVSIYIGPPKGAKPIYPYDYLEVYISGDNGYDIGGIKAQYLFRLYGIGGEIKGYEFKEYNGEKFVNKNIDFHIDGDLAHSWSRVEFKLPISIGNRNVLYRVVSFGGFYEDMAHEPFKKSTQLSANLGINVSDAGPNAPKMLGGVVEDPDADSFAGYFAKEIEEKYYGEVDINVLDAWISTLDLAKGAESTHVFTSKDFVDGNVSHFKEEDYAYQKLKEIVAKEGRRPVYRVELLNESIFREEWENLTNETRHWEILHWLHDLENTRLHDAGYSNPYKLNWYDQKEIRSIEWLVYKLSEDLTNWKLGFEIVMGIKSIDDARIGPFLAVYPTKDARLKDWSAVRADGPTATVTFQLVHWYSGTSDCHGDNDGYVKITVGGFTYVSGERDDDDSWNAKIIVTDSNNTGSTAYIRIENWEADSGLCGSDDDYGSATMTYYISSKTWSGATSLPYVHTSGHDGSADDWFVIESSDDDEAKLGVYTSNGDSDPMYGGVCLNDPWDTPTIVTYYGGAHYWGYGYYVSSYYAFYVPSGKTISVHLQPSSYNYDLYLYDPSGNQKATSTNGGTSEDDITFTADSSGYWIINIYASGGYADYFQFWFTSGPDDKNFVDISPSTGNGDTGYLIQSYGGVTYYDSSDDWKFYVPSSWVSGKGVLYFWMKPNPNADFNLQLYDPAGNLKNSSAKGGAGQAEYVIYELQSSDSAGYWYARILPASSSDYGNYTIFFWAGYVVDFYAQTDNSGAHTPMHADNGVKVTYSCLGDQYEVYPNDDYYWEVYVDRGSSYSYASESNLSNDANGHRWISQNPPSGTINTGGSITGHYYEQFNLTIKTAYDTGYSSGKYFGADKSYSNPGSGWYDAGCTVTIRVDSPVSSGGYQYAFVSWSGSGTGSYTGTANPANFTIQDVTTETANWQQVPEFSDYIFFVPLLFALILIVNRRK